MFWFSTTLIYNASRINISIVCVLLDELTARRNIITHKHRERTFSFCRIFNRYLPEKPLLRVHGRGLQLFCTHFSETFITLYKDSLFRTLSQL